MAFSAGGKCKWLLEADTLVELTYRITHRGLSRSVQAKREAKEVPSRQPLPSTLGFPRSLLVFAYLSRPAKPQQQPRQRLRLADYSHTRGFRIEHRQKSHFLTPLSHATVTNRHRKWLEAGSPSWVTDSGLAGSVVRTRTSQSSSPADTSWGTHDRGRPFE
ncbi:uncharacterized protein BO95DRAFT_431004 [Aspergillus brunneoviolaceus CBS 621.78]|uniref:Uncharacterized protein n=1 Tax=Aspergillus brunneoviolaceus CBS 621.78 TaxID=1450534 RepID=A0ACD1GBQ2_9EURO|nr:hypothetical protein BO95DRAFT_431004 [Aspergillus brunneoviolaceus CBS 621.78]RAH46678.1 hypothetical protein BO95DRAFT_431004 [Aspergillus brunneoviolaceus CBS 621.78]